MVRTCGLIVVLGWGGQRGLDETGMRVGRGVVQGMVDGSVASRDGGSSVEVWRWSAAWVFCAFAAAIGCFH